MTGSQVRRPQVTVIGDSDAPPELCSLAEQIGGMLARLGITVITGGRGGVMEAVCRGAANAGGTTIGILPSSEINDANQWCTVVIATGLGHARNVVNVLSGDLVIALGSSAGTLSEVCFAWIHGKPILTVKGYDRWLEQTGNELDSRGSSKLVECADLESLRNNVITICGKLPAQSSLSAKYTDSCEGE